MIENLNLAMYYSLLQYLGEQCNIEKSMKPLSVEFTPNVPMRLALLWADIMSLYI